MLKITSFIILLTAISACSTNYYISTNLDKKNFKEYFSAAAVKIYKSEQELPTAYKFVGAVEGQDCQIKAHHAAPDEVNARTAARKQAFAQQANGIIFSGCAVLNHEELKQLSKSNDAQQCHAITICYGKAYLVDETK